jgi:hypothetical protein
VSDFRCFAANSTEELGSSRKGVKMFVGVVGRGDRQDLGALCPSVSMVPGADDHNTGDTLRRDPVWETVFRPVAPAPAAPVDNPFSFGVEAAMTRCKDNFPYSQRRRVTLQVTNPDAAGIDVGARPTNAGRSRGRGFTANSRARRPRQLIDVLFFRTLYLPFPHWILKARRKAHHDCPV